MTEKKWFLVEDCRTYSLKRFDDARGSLVPIECGVDMPFVPQRVFTTFGFPAGTTRGEHANLRTHEFIVCQTGALTVWVYDGSYKKSFRLDRPDVGLIVPPSIWIELRDFAPETCILVLASHGYDPAEYIRELEPFEQFRKEQQQ